MRVIETDYLVIGAGLIGSAVTLGLSQLGVDRVTLIDLDLSGEWSSSELNRRRGSRDVVTKSKFTHFKTFD